MRAEKLASVCSCLDAWAFLAVVTKPQGLLIFPKAILFPTGRKEKEPTFLAGSNAASIIDRFAGGRVLAAAVLQGAGKPGYANRQLTLAGLLVLRRQGIRRRML